jgi:hypothetical protein
MSTAHIVVNVLLAVALISSAITNFVRYQRVLDNMAKVHVPESWLTPLGLVKIAGALGLLVGLRIPWVGIAASAGAVLFFGCALLVHLRARDDNVVPATTFGLVAVAALALGLAA